MHACSAALHLGSCCEGSPRKKVRTKCNNYSGTPLIWTAFGHDSVSISEVHGIWKGERCLMSSFRGVCRNVVTLFLSPENGLGMRLVVVIGEKHTHI